MVGNSRTIGTNSSDGSDITLPAGHKWRITIDDIHFCHGHEANHGLGALFTVAGSGVTIANRYITDDNRSSLVKVGTSYKTAIMLDGYIGYSTDYSYWPKSFSAYDSGYEAYTASSGEIGPEASEGTPGVQFIYETDTVETSTTLKLRVTGYAHKSSSCKADAYKGVSVNGHYFVETID